MTLALLVTGTLAYGGTEQFMVLRNKQLVDGQYFARRFHEVEACTGLRAPLPRLARAESQFEYCDDPQGCLPGGYYGYYENGVIYLPEGNGYSFHHEAVHHLKWVNQGDISHNGNEWRCAPEKQ